ncbi:transporter associated domain-containing protein, partial [Paenibacillus favisporus]
EEIVGEIRDEFDKDEVEDIQEIGEQHLIVDGKVSISMINDYFFMDLDTKEWDTIGGWLYSQISEMAEGETFVYEGTAFTLLERDHNRYCRIEIKKIKMSEE